MIFYSNTLICGQLTTLPLMLQQSSLPTCRPPLSAPKPHIPLPHSSHHTSHFLIPTLGSTRHSRTPLSPLTSHHPADLHPLLVCEKLSRACHDRISIWIWTPQTSTSQRTWSAGHLRSEQTKEQVSRSPSDVNKPKNRSPGHLTVNKPKNRSAGHPQTPLNHRKQYLRTLTSLKMDQLVLPISAEIST